ncbi:hypothetical protein J6590_042852 [Homalodisca vitripennis]|nr:hypothetical protein J6590_042852 [Homalodisca vitripennis]
MDVCELSSRRKYGREINGHYDSDDSLPQTEADMTEGTYQSYNTHNSLNLGRMTRAPGHKDTKKHLHGIWSLVQLTRTQSFKGDFAYKIALSKN